MNTAKKPSFRRGAAMLLSVALALSALPGGALAAQEDQYHDPAEHWMSASNRTNELDVNSVVTKETFHCATCDDYELFEVFRTPEYSRDGKSALTRNVMYSDGTMVDGVNRGTVLFGTPGKDAAYTGYHWTKAVCQNCGTLNSNMGRGAYGYGKNIYGLNDCAQGFMHDLPVTVTYQPADHEHHLKTTHSGNYCIFCYGTRKAETSALERHSWETSVTAQPDNSRFAVTSTCTDCGAEESRYVSAKSVVADYYGVVDGQPHTLTVSDLSEAGVTTQIRYGNSAESCTLSSAPNYTEKGQYTVYYDITYTYRGASINEPGVAYVWLREDAEQPPEQDSRPDPDAPCDKNEGHNFVLLETVHPTCLTMGYDRYLCTACGKIERRNYTNELGHSWQQLVLRDPTCETDGKKASICSRCGQVKESSIPKGEHRWRTSTLAPTCTAPGYTLKECTVCGQRSITNVTPALPHSYQAQVTPATCIAGGHTTHVCRGCGSSFVTDYTEPLGHSWDQGRLVSDASCTGEGVMEYHCVRCRAHRLEGDPAKGHKPGPAATCTEPQLCTACGAVLQKPLGHHHQAVVTAPTCTEMGFTTYTCDRCGDSYVADYTEQIPHSYKADVTDPNCHEMGYTTYVCEYCGKRYVGSYTDPHAHQYEAAVTPPTCTEMGYTTYTCKLCGDSYVADYTDLLTHSYQTVVTPPTCTEMGYTTITCTHCGDTHKSEYTEPLGHKAGDWIIDREPTTQQEGSKHTACVVCGQTLETVSLEKLYLSATTDTHGQAVVGRYLVTVTDTATRNPVANAAVALRADQSLTVRLPDGRLIDYAHQTTVTVQLSRELTPVTGLPVTVSDRNGNVCRKVTDAAGQLTIPDTTGITDEDGKTTTGHEDADGNRSTITVKVEDHETGRPIRDAQVSIGKGGNITVILPDGVDMGPNDRITITVTDQHRKPRPGASLIVKGDLGKTETGTTDEDGRLTLPEVVVRETHAAYIMGYPDGSFGPERSMLRSEAAAIFARILADRRDEQLPLHAATSFLDVDAGDWYSGYVKYLHNYGVIYGRGNRAFAPDSCISRAEFIAMTVRFFSVYGSGNQEIMEQYSGFSDLSEGYWAAKYIRDAVIHGWISGYPDGTIRADHNISRAEAVTILNRLLDRTADEAYISRHLRSLNTFADAPARHWAYYAILEAANSHTAIHDPEEAWVK